MVYKNVGIQKYLLFLSFEIMYCGKKITKLYAKKSNFKISQTKNKLFTQLHFLVLYYREIQLLCVCFINYKHHSSLYINIYLFSACHILCAILYSQLQKWKQKVFFVCFISKLSKPLLCRFKIRKIGRRKP